MFRYSRSNLIAHRLTTAGEIRDPTNIRTQVAVLKIQNAKH